MSSKHPEFQKHLPQKCIAFCFSQQNFPSFFKKVNCVQLAQNAINFDQVYIL